MSRFQLLMRAGLLACGFATSPAVAQVVGPDQSNPPPGFTAQPHARADRFIEHFRAANTSGDGRLTLAQAAAGNLPMIVRHFDAIDAQHKGYVTLQDIQAYRRQMRGMREGGYAKTN